jgi:membrane protease YdiL (CAAX protease family)
MADASTISIAYSRPLSALDRWISLGEFLWGTFLVIGHNVFHIVPNEVPLLFLLFWLSARLRKGQGRVSMLSKPKSWLGAVLLGLAGAAVLLLGSEFVIQPLAAHFWPAPENVSSILKMPVHDWKLGLRSLAIVWIFAAFGEEIGYRGYLLTRAADVGKRSRIAYIFAMLCVAVIFGFAHFYKGPAGVVDSTYSGLILGTVYLCSRGNLWAAILAHGFADTIAVFAVFMGWAN